MSITYVGRGYTYGTGNASHTITFGTTNWANNSPSAGDIVVLTIAKYGDNSGSFTIDTSGYTSLTTNTIVSSGTNTGHLYCAYKIMGTTPDSNVAITGFGFDGYGLVVGVTIFRNVSSSNPIDVTTTTATGNLSANPPAITTITNDSIVIAVIGDAMGSNRTISGAPSGYTLSFGYTYSKNGYIMHGVGYKIISTAGLEDPASFSVGSSGSSDRWSSATIALRIVSSGPANLKSLNTNLKANIKSIDGVLIANVKSLDTII